MKLNKRKPKLTVEALEPRTMLSRYSLTEISWLPKTSSGYQPIAINNSGLMVVDASDTQTSYVCTIAHHRAYAAPSGFVAAAINNSGELAGWGTDGGIYGNNEVTSLPAVTLAASDNIGGQTTDELIPSSINDNGSVAGSVGEFFPPPPSVGLGGVNTDLPAVFNASTGEAVTFGIGNNVPLPVYLNDSGLMAFSAGYVGSDAMAYNTVTKTKIDIGALFGDLNSSVTGLNQNGQIVGTYVDAKGNRYSFIYDSETGSLQKITLQNDFEPTGINDSGVAIGTAGFLEKVRNHQAWESHAAMYAAGKLIDLNSLVDVPNNVVLTQAVAINDSGSILVSDADSSQDAAQHCVCADATPLNGGFAHPPAMAPIM